MNDRTTIRRGSAFGRLAGWSALAALVVAPISAQPRIDITSPGDGTIVNPGTSFTVTVTANPPDGVRMIWLLPQHPLKVKGPAALTAPPYRFTVEVPRNIWADRFSIVAWPLLADGPREGPSMDVDVERPDVPFMLKTELSSLHFDFAGDLDSLLVYGSYADGSQFDVTHSTLTKYSAGSEAIVKVTSEGLATAVGPGSTVITIENRGAKVVVPVVVARGKPPQ